MDNQFFTKINIPESSIKIDYHDRLMTLGSCFAENIGKKLNNAFFQIKINPFGVLYNPFSIIDSIEKMLSESFYTYDEIFENQSLWSSFSHSSFFSGVTKEECFQKINQSLDNARLQLQQTTVLLITFGTAQIYEDIRSGRVVANCHKFPSRCFTHRRLSVDEIVKAYNDVLPALKQRFPQLKIIFTVSPIRHWKDGAFENNLSKSTLLLSINRLVEGCPFAHYFPAYEIQMDELRDYRFYNRDMLHPNEIAIDYIWQRFSETYFEEETVRIKKMAEQLYADLNHRPLHPTSKEYQLFLQSIEKRKMDITSKYPFLKI